jgi:serine/threonine protein kinase/WD40 repeat protein
MIDSPSQHDPVGLLAEEFLVRYRRGDRPTITEYVVRHPELADQIRDVFPALVMMEQAGEADGDADSGRFGLGRAVPRRLGDYRLVREVGRGGMGVVYEAVQESLGRRVALKVLPYEVAADPISLKRFQREARAAARLHHTNIAPVHDIGECGGLHYYAMQFIDGKSLAEVLAEPRTQSGDRRDWLRRDERGSRQSGSTTVEAGLSAGVPHPTVGSSASDISGPPGSAFYRSVARLGLQVAEALEYAHGQGVIHRDVKPSNIMIDPAGTAWVTDFGLAKEEGDDLTRTGDVVGTLRYLPPERFAGGCDARGDLYGLGLTLYELLAGRPAFDEADRGRLIKQVAHDEPPPPRQCDPRVPRDLETIVLRAAAKDPDRRYGSAASLADDLQRYLTDRPIRARRVSWPEQVWRWARRNPSWAAMLTTVSTLLLIIAVGGIILNLRLRSALVRATDAERDKTEKLWETLVERARAIRMSGRLGQRSESLDAIREAARIRIDPELRNEAIAAFALPDAEIVREWEGLPGGTAAVSFDAQLVRFVRMGDQGDFTLGRLTAVGEEITAQIPSRCRPRPRFLVMSPDGRYVATWYGPEQSQSSARLDVWAVGDPAPSTWLGEVAFSRDFAVAFSGDGLQLAVGGTDGTIDIFDLKTRRLTRRLTVAARPTQVAFDPKGSRLAVAAGRAVRLFDLATGRERRPLPHPAGVSSVAWHPDGLHIATGCDIRIHYWDVAAAAEIMRPWTGHRTAGVAVVFDATGNRLLSLDWGRLTRVWDTESGRLLLDLSGETGLQFGPDGLLCCKGPGKLLRMRRVTDGRELRMLRHRNADSNAWVTEPIVQGNAPVAATVIINSERPSPPRLVFFNLVTGKELTSVGLPEANAGRVAGWDPSGGWLTIGTPGVLYWPAQPDPSGKDQLRVGPPRQVVSQGGNRLGMSSDAQVLAVPQQRRIAVLDRRRPGRLVSVTEQFDLRFAAVSPDGRRLIAGSHEWDGLTSSSRVWDVETGQQIADFLTRGRSVAQFSPNGRWAAVGTYGQGCRLWDTAGWRPVRHYENADNCFSFSPGSRMLAVSDQLGVIRLVEVETGAEVMRLTSPEPIWFSSVTFAPTGNWLLATDENMRTIYVWDLPLLRTRLDELGLGLEWPEPVVPIAGPGPSAVVVDSGFLGNPDVGEGLRAVVAVSLSVGLTPLNPQAYLDRGRAFSNLGRGWAHLAVVDYSTYLTLVPPEDRRRPEVLLSRADALTKCGRHAAAAADLRELLALPAESIDRPDTLARIANNVAWQGVLGAVPEIPPEGLLSLARKAVELEPFSVLYQNTLGGALFAADRYQDAIDRLERNLKANSECPAYDLYILAMCRQRIGQPERAHALFHEADAWCNRHTQLDAGWKEDLQRLRAVAAAVLGDTHTAK